MDLKIIKKFIIIEKRKIFKKLLVNIKYIFYLCKNKMNKADIEKLFQDKSVYWEYGRNDQYYTHYDFYSEFMGMWFSNHEKIDCIFLQWINPNNGNSNNIPFDITTIEELDQLLKLWKIYDEEE